VGLLRTLRQQLLQEGRVLLQEHLLLQHLVRGAARAACRHKQHRHNASRSGADIFGSGHAAQGPAEFVAPYSALQ
jgi:hypothetical protein